MNVLLGCLSYIAINDDGVMTSGDAKKKKGDDSVDDDDVNADNDHGDTNDDSDHNTLDDRNDSGVDVDDVDGGVYMSTRRRQMTKNAQVE